MRLRVLVVLAISASLSVTADDIAAIANPSIDMDGFLSSAADAAKHRRSRRLTEGEFIAMAREPGTIVLDARSRENFERLHVRGATNLSFSDISVGSLAALLPDRSTRILIYCNNNFAGNEVAFATKLPGTSLNLSTYVTLYQYGYRNVYELGPLLDVSTTKLELVGSAESKN